ncbi:putative transposase, partial [Granulicatella balaenopterae]
MFNRKPNKNWILKSATISQEKDNKYYVSVLFEYVEEVSNVEITDKIIGLDYKSDGLYADSEGKVCGSPKYYRKSHKRLAKLQRQLSKKEKGSNNREKARKKVAKLHRHISNQRLDFLHKESTRIANLYEVV